MFNFVGARCGPSQKPNDVSPYRKFFRAPLCFDAAQKALVFGVNCLDHPLPESDPGLRRVLLKEMDELEATHGDDFPGQVRSVLRIALLTVQARSEQVVALFAMHSRFQQFLDEGRFENARQLLEDPRMEISQVAMMLNYADASAFTHAFQRWSGTTPAQWRDNHMAAEQPAIQW